MKEKILTIGIPNYNGGENLKRAIKSCKDLNLKEEEYEILVVDNCSTDNSIEIIKELQKDIKNIRLVINDTNIGRIGNWNKVVNLAEGKYFIFLFSNDYFCKDNKIIDNLNILENNLSIGLINSKYYELYKGKFIPKKNEIDSLNKEYDINYYIKILLETSSLSKISPLQSLILRTNILKRYKFNDNIPFFTDQITIIEYLNNFGKIVLSSSYQVIWENNANRYFSLKNKNDIKIRIKEHIIGIKYLKKIYNFNSNKYFFNYFLGLIYNYKLNSYNYTNFFIKQIGLLNLLKGFNFSFIFKIIKNFFSIKR